MATLKIPPGVRSPSNLASYALRLVTAAIRVLPDFLIIGAQRAGTTSLYHYLVAHPDIRAARTKEVHFFDRRFRRGLYWYRSNFPVGLGPGRYGDGNISGAARRRWITGEATPNYLFYPEVPRLVLQALPTVKVIVLLRNPVDRAYSHYWHACDRGREARPFEDAIADERARLTSTSAGSGNTRDRLRYDWHSYLERGLYLDQLRRWVDLTSREAVEVVQSERLFAEPQTVVRETLEFLGVSPRISGRFVRHNAIEQMWPMKPATREWLVEFFRPHNERLFEFLGTRFGWQG